MKIPRTIPQSASLRLEHAVGRRPSRRRNFYLGVILEKCLPTARMSFTDNEPNPVNICLEGRLTRRPHGATRDDVTVSRITRVDHHRLTKVGWPIREGAGGVLKIANVSPDKSKSSSWRRLCAFQPGAATALSANFPSPRSPGSGESGARR